MPRVPTRAVRVRRRRSIFRGCDHHSLSHKAERLSTEQSNQLLEPGAVLLDLKGMVPGELGALRL